MAWLMTIMTLCCLLPTCHSGSESDEFLEVTSPVGTFRGTVLVSRLGHLYLAFLGIPYALPPVDELRFAKPRPYPKIAGLFDAAHLPPICIQPIGVDLGSPAQEDCLYLNVYMPIAEKEKKSIDTEPLKKVFVYIHGGAFFMGSTREYMPGDLVTLGNVIVVTLNYRLSWLGFLKGNTPELPGNQGMWDQLMALQWVKDNIKSFGGDPDDITIGGNSMGGESVSAWNIVPHGKDLFTKGYLMSGTLFASPSTPGSSDVLLDLLTDRVGCKNDDIEKVVQCLRELPSESFVLPYEGTLTNKFTTIDGDLFSAPIGKLIKDRDYLRSVGFYDKHYLVTLTNNEGAVYCKGSHHEEQQVDPAKFLSKKFRTPHSVCEKVWTWYNQTGHYSFNPVFDMIGDPILALPCFQFLEIFASYNEGDATSKSRFLWFDHLPSYLPPHLEGMGHGLDLPYLFDLHPDEMLQSYYGVTSGKDFTEEDFKLREEFINILVDFMKTGDPGTSLAKEYKMKWPAFDVKLEHYLNFGPKPAVKQFPLKERRHFWKETFPQYLEDYRNSHPRDEL